MLIEFTVYGEQKPQGSKIAQAIYRKGKDGKPIPVMKNGRVITVARNDNPDVIAWRQGIAEAAAKAYSGPLLEGPIAFSVEFYKPRPRSHYGTGKNSGILKVNAPGRPIGKPDNSKLRRAIEDALTGVIYRDDSQIVYGTDIKNYGPRYETRIKIVPVI